MLDIRESVLTASGLMREAPSHVARTYLEGNRLVSISGVLAVREYSLGRMRIQTEGGQIIIYGSGLVISAIGEGAAAVRGVVDKIEFDLEGDG